jgi:uncharacterized protein with ATP-grasp and redox domains
VLAPPPRIRTDVSNPFAHHTMAVRVPAIIEGVLRQNSDYAPEVVESLNELRAALPGNAPLPPLGPEGPARPGWLAALEARAGQTWLATDWFFAENYVYRQIADRTGFWHAGRDPFRGHKREEYASPAHARALQAALAITGEPPPRFASLFAAAVFGNRIDLSFAASLERGVAMATDDLLVDDRARAAARLLEGSGALHVIVDNAGKELSIDLALADAAMQTLGLEVVLHVKLHPAFVSDAVAADVRWFVGEGIDEQDTAPVELWGEAAQGLRERLRSALHEGQLQLAPHAFWNGPESLWQLPEELVQTLDGARLVVLKGDAHYRRALGDALWAPETSFAEATSYFPAPLLALRTLKSDPIVGLAPGQAGELERDDPTWRVNGKRGVASLGGAM